MWKDYDNLHKEKVKVVKVLNDSSVETEIFKQNLNEPDNKVEPVFICPFCQDHLKCMTELSQHVRIKHGKDKMSKTVIPKILQSAMSNYPCFYCEEDITSYKNLQKHPNE